MKNILSDSVYTFFFQTFSDFINHDSSKTITVHTKLYDENDECYIFIPAHLNDTILNSDKISEWYLNIPKTHIQPSKIFEYKFLTDNHRFYLHEADTPVIVYPAFQSLLRLKLIQDK